jgi:hypothetical protein
VARDYGISRYWVQQLVSRYQPEGPAAFSRGPEGRITARTRSIPTPRMRSFGCAKSLSKQGLDAGAETIAAHLARQTPIGGGQLAVPAVSIIWRILSRSGLSIRNHRNGPDRRGARLC